MRSSAMWLGFLCTKYLFGFTSFSEDTSRRPSVPPRVFTKPVPFLPGEKLVFRVHYGWLTAGEATFEVYPKIYTVGGLPVYVFRGSGKTASAFEWFYKVRDYMDSYVDTAQMRSLLYYRWVNEGDFHFVDTVFFDYNKWEIRGRKGRFPMDTWVMDMLGAFYYARRLNIHKMSPGTVVPIPVFLDDKVYQLGMKVLGRETIKTDLGTFRCIKITPIVVADRVFRGQEEMIMWVTDDENLIPVKITSPIIVGSVSATLKSYQNLKYPLSSRID
ncbi:MAG: DUF3108 domain-containing protein [Bacteroidia bacterium]|nr:DUF3108 domain-containing protein [Bacteroidia bacterium]MCX7652463.1 DUF3108 domain-containing protein [Bacteroidia bacterium]MDW8416865.1 DUF3108 domain-containing protein [Bacteroidia bacterium]